MSCWLPDATRVAVPAFWTGHDAKSPTGAPVDGSGVEPESVGECSALSLAELAGVTGAAAEAWRGAGEAALSLSPRLGASGITPQLLRQGGRVEVAADSLGLALADVVDVAQLQRDRVSRGGRSDVAIGMGPRSPAWRRPSEPPSLRPTRKSPAR